MKLLLLIASVVCAAAEVTATAPAVDSSPVTQFVSPDTSVVLDVDASQLDPEKLGQWLSKLFKEADRETANRGALDDATKDSISHLQDWLTQFRKLGGQHIYQFSGAPNVADVGTYWVMPTANVEDAKRLKKWFDGQLGLPKPANEVGNPIEPVVVAKTLFLISNTGLRTVQREKGAPSADLAEAIAAAGGSPIKCVYVAGGSIPSLLNEEMRRELEGVRWASVAIDAPPRARVHVEVRMKDAPSATRLARFADGKLGLVAASDRFKGVAGVPDVLPVLKPRAVGDRLRLELTADETERLAIVILRAMNAAEPPRAH